MERPEPAPKRRATPDERGLQRPARWLNCDKTASRTAAALTLLVALACMPNYHSGDQSRFECVPSLWGRGGRRPGAWPGTSRPARARATGRHYVDRSSVDMPRAGMGAVGACGKRAAFSKPLRKGGPFRPSERLWESCGRGSVGASTLFHQVRRGRQLPRPLASSCSACSRLSERPRADRDSTASRVTKALTLPAHQSATVPATSRAPPTATAWANATAAAAPPAPR